MSFARGRRSSPPARSARVTVPWCTPRCRAIVPTGQPSARDSRTIVARVSSSIAMRSPSLSSPTPRSGVRQHQPAADPAADGAPQRRFPPIRRRQGCSWRGPRGLGSVVRSGFFRTGVFGRLGDVDGHGLGGRFRGRRPGRGARRVRLADPAAPLAFPARLAALLRAPAAFPRLAAPLAPGARAARPGAVRLPAVAVPADHDLPPAPLAVEQAPRLARLVAHRPSLERGGPGRENA